MDKEEAIEILSSRDNHGMPCGYTNGYVEALDMAIEALKTQPEWIPVSEKLPKEWEHVLVMTDTPYTFNKIMVDWNVDNYWVNYGHHVIAWMPLPEPYKAESEKA